MTLKEYSGKRDFKKTSEPRAIKHARTKKLIFVVQKHDASHLHYDLRLENSGVLKSWAVPKGISIVPGERRLAIQVEDHPYEYKDFEGTIPKGSYGAGTVEIWDKGTYFLGEGSKKDHLKFTLLGSKFKGEYSLIKLKDRKDQWLIIKKKPPIFDV